MINNIYNLKNDNKELNLFLDCINEDNKSTLYFITELNYKDDMDNLINLQLKLNYMDISYIFYSFKSVKDFSIFFRDNINFEVVKIKKNSLFINFREQNNIKKLYFDFVFEFNRNNIEINTYIMKSFIGIINNLYQNYFIICANYIQNILSSSKQNNDIVKFQEKTVTRINENNDIIKSNYSIEYFNSLSNCLILGRVDKQFLNDVFKFDKDHDKLIYFQKEYIRCLKEDVKNYITSENDKLITRDDEIIYCSYIPLNNSDIFKNFNMFIDFINIYLLSVYLYKENKNIEYYFNTLCYRIYFNTFVNNLYNAENISIFFNFELRKLSYSDTDRDKELIDKFYIEQIYKNMINDNIKLKSYEDFITKETTEENKINNDDFTEKEIDELDNSEFVEEDDDFDKEIDSFY